MEHKIPCSIVSDLLPNYIEKLTSEETNTLLEEHIATCPACKAMHEEMEGEMESEINQENLKDEKASSFLFQAKLGYAFKIVMKVLRIVSVVLYVGLNIYFICMEAQMIDYFSLMDKMTLQSVGLIALITAVIPGILIAVLFIKKEHIVLKTVQIILQMIILAIFPLIFMMGIFSLMVLPESTTNPKNYAKWNEWTEEMLAAEEFSVLPEKLPENIQDIDYFYRYRAIFDDEYLNLKISWSYEDEKDYEQAKAVLQNYETPTAQSTEDGFQMIYALGDEQSEDGHFYFGYRDKDKRIVYEIYCEDEK
ncbi:zf-HC2 domain-containing protein [Konateibacter massiliensis]|uniref:zf-HC2 domain-containing protein n=1 Tax=Konateibacter massiliensis TaxID=2002841 RepID=UPI000C155B0A|nr:zf-HC2 domain-containing protein [Konateibacter massiliensis]